MSLIRDGSGPSAWNISQDMFSKTKALNSVIYKMTKSERIDGKIQTGKALIKVNYHPYKVYLKRLEPNGGLEALYIEGENKNKILINPAGFPWFNLNLSPYSSMVRENNHHTMLDNGFRKLIQYLEHNFNQVKDEFNELSQVNTNADWKGTPCYKIETHNPHFGYITYTTKAGETPQSIADKYGINSYRIIEKNSNVKGHDELTAGTVIEVPKYYAKDMVIYIEKARLIPKHLEVYDDEGLYEEFEWNDVQLNPPLTDKDFSSDNEEYGF